MATSGIAANSTGSGTVSNDIYNRVQQTMASQNKGATKLNDTLARDQTKLSGLGQLQSALSDFQTLAKALSGNGLSTSASSSAKTVVTTAATGAAKPGTYAVDVKQLAQGQFLTSADFDTSSAKIGTGAATTVKIDFGTAGDKGFVVNGTSTSKSITIDSSNNTLDGIAAAFKAAGVDVKVVKDDKGYSLAVAGQAGEANSLRISVSGDAALKDLLAYNPDGTQKLKQTAAAQDALATVDGKDVKSASNTLDKALDGVSLTLTGAGKSDVVVTQDASQIGTNVKAFVAAYNDLNKKLQTLQNGSLKSDTALNQVSSQLSLLLKTGGGTVTSSALSAVGVTLDSSGNLKVDDKKLQSALTADSTAVSKLFTNNGKGLADQLATKAAAFTSDTSVISREANSVNKEITSVNAKRAVLSKALTAQANALAALYTQQAQSGAGSAFNSSTGSSSSLFDLLA